MFSVGLEFSLPQLTAMRRTVFGFGGAQVALTMALAAAVALAAGQSWKTGLIVGGVLAMSSTAIVSKTLSEQAQLHTPGGAPDHGRAPLPGPRGDPAAGADPGARAAARQALAGAIVVALVKAAVVLAVVLFVGPAV